MRAATRRRVLAIVRGTAALLILAAVMLVLTGVSAVALKGAQAASAQFTATPLVQSGAQDVRARPTPSPVP